MRMITKNKPYRSEKYKAFIRTKRCLVCSHNDKIQAHHESFGQSGMASKPSDLWTVPLCWVCHRMRHDKGFKSFWEPLNVDIKLEMLKLINAYMEAENAIQTITKEVT